MFSFFDTYDTLSNEKVTLKLCGKYPENKGAIPFYYYDIYDKNNNSIGKISIRIGHNYTSYYNGNIGYEIDESYRGNNYSYYASLLVLEVAKAHNMDKLYLTCRESNIPSRKIIEKLGGTLDKITSLPSDYIYYRPGLEDQCIYSLNL